VFDQDNTLRLLEVNVIVSIHKFRYRLKRRVEKCYLELILSLFWLKFWFVQPITQGNSKEATELGFNDRNIGLRVKLYFFH
jgi:hypothetical protein